MLKEREETMSAEDRQAQINRCLHELRELLLTMRTAASSSMTAEEKTRTIIECFEAAQPYVLKYRRMQGVYAERDGTRGLIARRPDPSTSHDAARDANKRLSERQEEILDLLECAGTRGLTSQEIADKIGVPRDSISPCMKPLATRGLVRDSGFKRQNHTGKMAIIYVAGSLTEMAGTEHISRDKAEGIIY